MKRIKFACFVTVVFMAGLVNAGSTWYGMDSGDVWSDSSNWIGDGLPGAGSWVEVGINWVQPCILDSDAGTIGTLHVGVYEDGGVSMVIKNGGSLTVSGGDVSLGWNRSGSLTIETGGSMTANCTFFMPMYVDIAGSYARMNLEGRNLTVNNLFWQGGYAGSSAGNARSQINAGILDVDALVLDAGVMDITNGKVIVAGDVSGSVASWIAAGRLTAFGGTGTIVAEVADGYTTITAIPEPATMALLALGALVTLRKKGK